MNEYREILKQQEKALSSSLKKKHGLICKQLQYGKDSAVLYLAKSSWTNRFDEERESTVGIFAAIWVSTALLKKQQFAYNIHSKHVRQLPGYKLQPRKFAESFREAVKSSVAGWPNIRLDYGPSTLLEGRCDCMLDTFSTEVSERVQGFVSIHHEIDKLLDKSKE